MSGRALEEDMSNTKTRPLAKKKIHKASTPNGDAAAGPGAAVAPDAAAAPDAWEEPYELTAERRAQLTEQAQALSEEEVMPFPGRSRDRVRSWHRIRIAAQRDAAELIQAPFHEEPPLTREEIDAQRDHIEHFRGTESEHRARRLGQAAASKQFTGLAAEAAGIKDGLLRAFDLRFRSDPAGQKRVSKIREGTGDADLVQDVSDVLLLASEHLAYLETCPRGEGAAVKRLQEISPQLSHLLGAKTLSEEARQARRARDAAYTLVMRTERRIRAAAEYWYGNTDRMKEYAVYVAPTRASSDAEAADAEDADEETPAGTSTSTSAGTGTSTGASASKGAHEG